MNDDTLNDLKQFIDSRISQSEQNIRTDIDSRISQSEQSMRADMAKLETRLSNKIDELSNSVAEALEATNASADTQLKDHEQRILDLEQKAA
jgi:hypothetical protein